MSNPRYHRDISERLQRLVKHFPAIVLTGARQTGKTTLLRHLFPNYSYVSLDLPSQAQLAEEDPDALFSKFPPPVIIDEVQYAPKIFRHLKNRVDKARKLNGQFLLTGSQKFTLMKEVSDSLAGRCGLLEIEPLSASELAEDLWKSFKVHGSSYLLARGGYPQLWDDPSMPRDDFFRSYVATYLERDVRQILNVISLRDFERFIRACVVRSGQLVNKSEVAKEVGISSKAANDWLTILHASNQVHLLEPYFANLGKRLIKSPKIYFLDSGIASFLMGLNHQNLNDSAQVGHLWESYVYSELRKELFSQRPEATLWFYRDQQYEVDFIISYGSKLYLLDAKWTQYPQERSARSLLEVKRFLKSADGQVYLVTPTELTTPISSSIKNLSGFKLKEFVASL